MIFFNEQVIHTLDPELIYRATVRRRIHNLD